MSKTVTVIDTFGFFFRSFYALPQHLRNKDGFPTGLLTGFTNFIATLQKQHDSDYLIFAIDTKGPTFRNDIDSNYKANRSAPPEELIMQLPIAIEWIDKMGYKTLGREGYEADDIIATVVKYAKDKAYSVRVVSHDKDLYQLIDDGKIVVVDAIKRKSMDEEACFEKYGVTPKQFIDYQSILGDSADNVPGVRGIGKVGAEKLLKEFGDLDNIYKNNILNINGGDTYISNSQPWLSYVAPLGLQRGEYYQIYTGAQNENVYTHNWLGPYWGFKKVVQTFKLTNSPRRLKPIDIYYHLYSGSKKAALNALKYVYDWSIKQDVFPIYTSAYIPKVMDYYTASMAEEKETFLINGMHNLKTVRVEKKNIGLDFEASKNIIGFNHFENHTYYHVGEKRSVQLKTSSLKTSENRPYLVSSNAKVRVKKFSGEKIRLSFEGYVPLKIDFHLPSNCSLKANPRVKTENLKNSVVRINYKKVKEAKIDVRCKL